MFELRILSGLHRGATLPLDEAALRIGASETADVVLVDPGIEEDHATLSMSDTGWTLAATGGKLFGSEDNLPQAVIDLVPGQFVRIGQVWIMVADVDDRWHEAPPVPMDEPPLDHAAHDHGDPLAMAEREFREPGVAAEDDVETKTEPVATTHTTDEGAKETAATIEAEMPTAAEQTATDMAATEDQEEPQPKRKKGLRPRMVFIPMAVVAVLSAAVAYGMNGKSSREMDGHKKGATGGIWKQDAAKNARGKLAIDPRSLTPLEVQQAFRRRLAEADLLKNVELTLEDLSWNLQGSMGDEEASRFERLLKGFIEEYRLTIPVNVKMVSPEAMLPFKVRQVITGPDASVVTQDGERLYVGDELKGVRLVGIQDSLLQFDGKRKIDIRW